MGHVLRIKQNNQLKKKKMNPCTQKQHDLPLVKKSIYFWNLNHIECELNSTQTYSY
jgi:hypothetical protein